jgi:hypothetical protein
MRNTRWQVFVNGKSYEGHEKAEVQSAETISLPRAEEVEALRSPCPPIPAIAPIEKQLSPLDHFLKSSTAGLQQAALTTVIGNPLARSAPSGFRFPNFSLAARQR